MRKSAIDIGSNTLRLLIGQVVEGKVEICHGEVRTTRLANGNRKEPLTPDAKARTLAALADFAQILQQWQPVEPPILVATSAMREACDGAAFAQEIQKVTGWQVHILSGKAEAFCSYRGAATVVNGPAMVLDVGGGSTELIWPLPQGGLQGSSIPLGAVRLQQHQLSPSILKAEMASLWHGAPSDLPLVAVGGTITALAAVQRGLTIYQREKVHGMVFKREELLALGQKIAACPLKERVTRWPMLYEREDLILDGLALVLTVLDGLSRQELIVSDAGILDGVLLGALTEQV